MFLVWLLRWVFWWANSTTTRAVVREATTWVWIHKGSRTKIAWQEWPIASKTTLSSRMAILLKTRVSTTNISRTKLKWCLAWEWAQQFSSRCRNLASSMAKREQAWQDLLNFLHQLFQSSSSLLLTKATSTRSWECFLTRSSWRPPRLKRSTWLALTSSPTWLRWLAKKLHRKWPVWLSTCPWLIWTTVFQLLRRCKRRWSLPCSCWSTPSTWKVTFWSACRSLRWWRRVSRTPPSRHRPSERG